MQTKFQRFGALVLTAALALTLCAPALAAEEGGTATDTPRASAVSDGTFLRGTFTFGPHENATDLTDTFIYSDSYFSGSSYEANEHLATMSMQMASASISSEDTTDYKDKSQNVQALLTALEFQDVQVNDCYQEQMGQNTMGVAVAYKPLDENTVLLAIVPRSAGYEKEWGGNFIVGNESDGLHKGFKDARDIALTFAKNYVTNDQRKDVFTGKTVKVWTMGYSRGAATANLIGAAIADNSYNIGVEVKPENVFAYTFGTPATVLPQNQANPRAEQYNGIHNYFADYDPVTMVPFADWGFTRYGQDVTYNTAGSKTRMLRFLRQLNPNVYDKYTTGGDPDNFQGYTLGEGLELTASEETTSQKTFLEGRIKILTEKAAENRGAYVSDYQEVISTLAGFYLGGDSATTEKFVEGISEKKTELTQLVLLLAFYDWAEQYASLTDAQSKANQAAVALKDALPKEEAYKDLNETITDGTKLNNFFTTSTTTSKSEYIQKTEGLMTTVLTAGFEKAGMGEADSIRTAVLNNVAGLTKFVGYFVFGTGKTLASLNSSDAIADALVEKINTAATLVGNSGSYMRVHNNEVILSWVRTMDSYYKDRSSGSSKPTYAVSIDESGHGAVSASTRSARQGARVTLTVTPEEGYALDKLTVTDSKENAIELTDEGDGKYSFVMPGSRVSVSAAFREVFIGPAYESFADLDAAAWYRDGVLYALKKGLMTGVSDTRFAPQATTSRAMAATILWRLAGTPAAAAGTSYPDCAAAGWYADAVAWATGAGIVGGYADGRFGPDDPLTREQMVTMLYRYVQAQGGSTDAGKTDDLSAYQDAGRVSAYAVPAVQWACGVGLLQGKPGADGGKLLDPAGNLTRAELATLLQRFGTEIA